MTINDAQLSPVEQRRVTAWRVLAAAYVRVQAAAEGKRAAELTEADRRSIIDRWSEALKLDFALVCELLEQARLAGVQDAHSTLQRIDAQDPILLDEATAIAREMAIEQEREAVLDARDARVDAREKAKAKK